MDELPSDTCLRGKFEGGEVALFHADGSAKLMHLHATLRCPMRPWVQPEPRHKAYDTMPLPSAELSLRQTPRDRFVEMVRESYGATTAKTVLQSLVESNASDLEQCRRVAAPIIEANCRDQYREDALEDVVRCDIVIE